jgi:GMP synthase (glutamine-hydrolysing)
LLLVVDNGSIYTKQLEDFLGKRGIFFEKQVPQSLDLNSLANYNSFILSGRKKNEKKINEINSKIIKHCVKNNVKLLGICYGAEILALTLGGTIRKTSFVQKGNESIQTLKDNLICNGYLDVFESHAYEISKLPSAIVSLANSKNCKYEIIQYKKKSIFGTQFHPEMSQDGNDLIEKFCLL